MRTLRQLAAPIAVAACLLAIRPARATTLHVTLNENGTMSFPGTNLPDVVGYDANASQSGADFFLGTPVNSGVLRILDANGGLSDLVNFVPAGSFLGPGLIFQSFDNGGLLADTTSRTLSQLAIPFVNVPESQGVAPYLAGPQDIGYITGYGGITYNSVEYAIVSGGDPVPEPASLALLTLGSLALLRRRRA